MNKRVVKFSEVRRQNWPYLAVWILYYAWALSATTIHTSERQAPMLFSADTRICIHLSLLLATAILISFIKPRWFDKLARLGALLLVIIYFALLFALPFALLLAPPPLYTAMAVLMGLAMGLVNFGILIPFVYILNNSEKFFAVLLANVFVGLFALMFHILQDSYYINILVSSIILLAALASVLRFKDADYTAEQRAIPSSKPKPIAYFTLVINFVFALIVLGVGKVLLDSNVEVNSGQLYIFYFIGGLSACLLYYLIFALSKNSLQIAWNLTFVAYFLAILVNSFSPDSGFGSATFALLIGVTTTVGIMNMFYNVGVIGKKYNNINHLKLPFWFGVAGGFCFVLIDFVHQNASNQLLDFGILILSAAMALFYFVAAPILTQNYFADKWVNDSEKSEVDGQLLQAFKKYGLSKREVQVCRLLLEGYTMQQVGTTLDISQATVNSHCTSLYRKTNVNSKIQLIKLFTV